MKKGQDAKGSIWRITSPKGQIFILSTVDEDLEFRRKIRSSTRGNLDLQKSISAHGLHSHKFEKLEKDIPRIELTTRKREIIMSTTRTTKRTKQKMVNATPEEFKARMEEYDTIERVALYDTTVQFMWVQRGGKWIEKSKTDSTRIRKYDEPWDKMGILDRMEMRDSFLQMGDRYEPDLEDLEDYLLPPIPEDD